MEGSSVAFQAPMLKDITPIAVNTFLDKNLDYECRFKDLSNQLLDFQPVEAEASINVFDLMATLASWDLKIAIKEVTDDALRSYLESFLKDSSRFWISMNTALKGITCDMKIVNPRSWVLMLMSNWTTVPSKYNLESQLVEKKGEKLCSGFYSLLIQEVEDDQFYEFVVERKLLNIIIRIDWECKPSLKLKLNNKPHLEKKLDQRVPRAW